MLGCLTQGRNIGIRFLSCPCASIFSFAPSCHSAPTSAAPRMQSVCPILSAFHGQARATGRGQTRIGTLPWQRIQTHRTQACIPLAQQHMLAGLPPFTPLLQPHNFTAHHPPAHHAIQPIVAYLAFNPPCIPPPSLPSPAPNPITIYPLDQIKQPSHPTKYTKRQYMKGQ